MSSPDDWEIEPSVKAAFDTLLEDLGYITGRIRTLVNASLTRKALREAKKNETATAARTAAGDVGATTVAGDSEGSSEIRKMIAAEVRSALERSSAGPSRKRKRDEGDKAAYAEKQLKVRGMPLTRNRLLIQEYFADSLCLSPPGEI